ncbi:hypothetical protein [Paraburkholderia sp. BR13444]|uniref:hypothetical protein n=1 Tax=Paraburkholderia sp. BR13444 TaxID=3236997 RepID=UPI0034CE38AF
MELQHSLKERRIAGSYFERVPKRMKARFNVGIVQYAPLAYDASWAMIDAMKNADSTDPRKYLETLRSRTFNGVTGAISFTPRGDLKTASATLYQQQNGKWTVLGVVQIDSH